MPVPRLPYRDADRVYKKALLSNTPDDSKQAVQEPHF